MALGEDTWVEVVWQASERGGSEKGGDGTESLMDISEGLDLPEDIWICGVRYYGEGADRARKPWNEAEANRGWEASRSATYVGGRIYRPDIFAEWYDLEFCELSRYMVVEAVRMRRKMNKWPEDQVWPEVGAWWCGTCGYPINYKKNRFCYPCGRSVDQGVRYGPRDLEGAEEDFEPLTRPNTGTLKIPPKLLHPAMLARITLRLKSSMAEEGSRVLDVQTCTECDEWILHRN